VVAWRQKNDRLLGIQLDCSKVKVVAELIVEENEQE
jgi:hypothetical protein